MLAGCSVTIGVKNKAKDWGSGSVEVFEQMSSNQINIKFEFLGTAKKTSKIQGQVLENLNSPASLSKCFEMLIQIYPGVGNMVDQSNGRLNRGFLMSINGERFSSELDVTVESDCEIVLFSADVGG